MDAGRLVSGDISINFLKERIKGKDCANGFPLDDCPRAIPQAEAVKRAGVKIDSVR